MFGSYGRKPNKCYTFGLLSVSAGEPDQLHADELCRAYREVQPRCRRTGTWPEMKSRPQLVWENVESQVVQTPYGFVVFDDTVIDKNFSHKIELVRRQYSGNAHGVIKGHWGSDLCVRQPTSSTSFGSLTIAFMIPAGDGKTKLGPCAGYADSIVSIKSSCRFGCLDG